MRLNKSRWLQIALIIGIIIIIGLVRYKAVVYTLAYPVYQNYEGNRIIRRITEYERLEAGDFYIRFTEGDRAASRELERITGEYGRLVLSFFDSKRDDPIGIVIFPYEEDLKGVLGIPAEHSAMGAYAGGKINLLSPMQYGAIHQTDEMLVNVFVHELAHLVMDDIAKGNYPLWFTEGIALYMEYYLLDYEWGSDIAPDTLYSIDDLTRRFSELDEYLAYRQSFLIVKGLIEQYGKDQYLKLLGILGEGTNFEYALKAVYGLSSEDIEENALYLN